MGLNRGVVSRKSLLVATGLLVIFRVSGIATSSNCKDFALRNVVSDEGDWKFYRFKEDSCLICLDGRPSMSSLNAALILPCQEQATDGRVNIIYSIHSESIDPLQTFSDTTQQCESAYANATSLTGEPKELQEEIPEHGGVKTGSFVKGHEQYLLKPSHNFPKETIICIKEVKYEDVSLAYETTETVSLLYETLVGTTERKKTDSTASMTTKVLKGMTTTTSSASVAKPTLSSKSSGNLKDLVKSFLIFPVVIVGLVALIAFGICQRKRIKRMTNPKSKKKENKYKQEIAIKSEEQKETGTSNEGTIYNPVYGDKKVNDKSGLTASGLQSFEAEVEYHEIREGESTSVGTIYNSAYEGFTVKREEAMLCDAANVAVKEIKSKRESSYSGSRTAEQSVQEVDENDNGNPLKKITLKENRQVYETGNETKAENKDRESNVGMIYNLAYEDIPSYKKEDCKRNEDCSAVNGIIHAEGSLYSTIDE